MQRFHVSVSVKNLQQSVEFYKTLFGTAPSVQKMDYAKWMLDDPAVNFSLSSSENKNGISHVGLQMDDMAELAIIQERLRIAGQNTVAQPDAKCCYARSSKTWILDPDNVAWETFVTHGEATYYGTDFVSDREFRPRVDTSGQSECCKTAANTCCAGSL